METSRETEIVDLPQELISVIISLTSPRDACRSALVSRWFRLAFDSDVAWEKFLPPDYEYLISQADAIPEAIRSGPKKDLYFYLCNNRIRIGNGNMSFSIDRESGKICFWVVARGLSIAWGDTPAHWQWVPQDEPGFLQVAKLINVWWLHVIAKVDTRILSPQTTYEAYLVFKFAENRHGFQNWPVNLCVNFEGGEDGEGLNAVLDSQGNIDDVMPQDREDGWKEVKIGEFVNENREGGSVSFSVKEVNDFHRKSGLFLKSIEVRPKLSS